MGVALVVSVPSTGYAVGLLDSGTPSIAATMGIAAFSAFTPASADPRVGQIVAERGGSSVHPMHFTPASTATNAAGRSVTVAVRVNTELARAISVRSAIGAADEARFGVDAGLRIAPTRYNLGIARGYQRFAKPSATLASPLSIKSSSTKPSSVKLLRQDIPDLAAFAPATGARDKPSRFAARVELNEGGAPTGEASSGLVRHPVRSSEGQTFDMAGSYRLTRNLDVTAGVRYSQERDRLAAASEIDTQDSQAVYIGTQFRF